MSWLKEKALRPEKPFRNTITGYVFVSAKNNVKVNLFETVKQVSGKFPSADFWTKFDKDFNLEHTGSGFSAGIHAYHPSDSWRTFHLQ